MQVRAKGMRMSAGEDSLVDQAERTLAERIEWLIRHMWPADARPPRTNAEVAEAITAATGEELSSTGVWKLRTGRGDNPTLKTLTALARFFKVPVGYFGESEEAGPIAGNAVLAAMLREKGITGATLRTLGELPVETRQMIAEMIESAARMEQRRSSKD
jgi:transcriptional regulator with XRE-family HTH domain